jgi:hypothetical protein
MGFHASFRAFHDEGRLLQVHPLPGAKKEGLLLPKGKSPDGFLQNAPFFLSQDLTERIGICRIGHLLKRVFGVFFFGAAQPGEDFSADKSPAIPVGDPAPQDPVKEDTPFLPWTERVTPHELEHGFLHQVKGLIAVPRGESGHLESPAFNLSQKPVEHFL